MTGRVPTNRWLFPAHGGRIRFVAVSVAIVLFLFLFVSSASAFRLIGASSGWARWDAAPRFVGGEDRSLEGGLRYSLETGTYAGLRDQISWIGSPPSDADFEAAVVRAFENWTIVDPATGLPAGFHFVPDLATAVVDQRAIPGNPNSILGLNAGAEIDVFVATPHAGSEFAASVIFYVDTTSDDLTLTSGTTGYAGLAISGADIRINPLYSWPLSGFEALLTHEIGHALGLADLEAPTAAGATSAFLDDDYDPASSVTAAATLTNSFALAIDPLDPDGSLLQAFPGNLNSDPGLDSAGVTLLMESEGYLDVRFDDPILQNDEFAARQFLYPVVVPEPAAGGMIATGLISLILRAEHFRFRGRSSQAG